MDPIREERKQSLAKLAALALNLRDLVGELRQSKLAPNAKKQAPTVKLSELADLLGVTKDHIAYRTSAARGELPPGRLVGNRREWSMDEARTIARHIRPENFRPEGCWAVTTVVANFKGGATKTTTTATLAQGLALRGHKGLVIDLDPQGSLSTLFGLLPATEVDESMTALPLFAGREQSLAYAVRPTYWPGIDLVAASPQLFGAEFALPARQKDNEGFKFWRVLDYGIDDLRDKYDFILIDTPPSLSYVTVNALLAADGLVMPLVPNALDFSSSVQFWELFTDLAETLLVSQGEDKVFQFAHVLPSRVDGADASTAEIRDWIQGAYGGMVLPVEIPKTSVSGAAAAEFGTVYDLPRGMVSAKTLNRARDAYERLSEIMEKQIQAVWAGQQAE